MNIAETEIEETLKDLLQHNISLYVKNKLLKKGTLCLFKQNNYHIELTLKINDVMKKFEIPIPFGIEKWKKDNLIYFDYRFAALAKDKPELLSLLKKLPRDGKSRFYDTILEIIVE